MSVPRKAALQGISERKNSFVSSLCMLVFLSLLYSDVGLGGSPLNEFYWTHKSSFYCFHIPLRADQPTTHACLWTILQLDIWTTKTWLDAQYCSNLPRPPVSVNAPLVARWIAVDGLVSPSGAGRALETHPLRRLVDSCLSAVVWLCLLQIGLLVKKDLMATLSRGGNMLRYPFRLHGGKEIFLVRGQKSYLPYAHLK
jgi:hypothetical protein